MAEQERKQKREAGDAPPEVAEPNPETIQKGKKLRKDLDELMDEIDEVLEENAEEFVKSYVQRGGE